jgi:hypothetical protein
MTDEKRKLLWVWSDMVGRCTNPNHRAFNNYGGRGISVCERWLTFNNFLTDMAPRPEGRMLDREDNEGNYEPSNCRWATRKEQNSNRRNCIYVDCDGDRVTLREYCRRKELLYRPIVKRIQDRGWSINDALSVPIGSRRAA